MTATIKPTYPVLDRTSKLSRVTACWPFHEGSGTTIYDVSGNCYHATIKSSDAEVGWASRTLYQSITGNSYLFNNSITGTYANLKTYANIEDMGFYPATGDISVSLWFNPSINLSGSSTNDLALFWIGDDVSTNDLRINFLGTTNSENVHSSDIAAPATGAIYGRLLTGNGATNEWRSVRTDATTWTANTWYHLVYTYDSHTKVAKIYINGSLQSTLGTRYITETRGTVESTLGAIGAHAVNQAKIYQWPGQIDLVSVYDFELSATEALSLYNDPLQIFTNDTRASVSVSSDFRLNRNKIIKASLRKIGIASDQATPTQLEEASEALNVLIKALQNEGTRLWTMEWTTQPICASMQVTIGGTIYSCIRSHRANWSNKPGTGDDWKSFWYVRGTTGGTWAEGEWYKCAGDIDAGDDTLSIESAFIRDGSGQQDTTLHILSRNKYFDSISNKYEESEDPCYLIFEQGLTSRITLWPIPSSTDRVLHYMRVRKLKDMDSASNDLDFWERWTQAIVYGLAANLADEYGMPPGKSQWLRQVYETEKNRAKSQDKDISDGDFVTKAY